MKLKGVLLQTFPSRKVTTKFGEKEVTDFKIKKDGKEIKCSMWGEVDGELLGKTVEFDCTESEYKGVKQYTVKGSIESVESEPETASAVETKGCECTTASVSVEPSSREDFRAVAEESVIKTIESAKKVAAATDLKATVSNIIELADLFGRTLTAISLDSKRR